MTRHHCTPAEISRVMDVTNSEIGRPLLVRITVQKVIG
jgi:hypothetical protein